MQAYFQQIFEEDTGRIKPDPPAWAVAHIRQVCYLVYKLEVPYSEEEESVVIQNFVSTEQEISSIDLDSNLDVKIASELTGGTIYDGTAVNIFGGFDPYDIIPKHGPGAVATGEKGEQKWDFTRLYLPIHQQYPYWQYTMLPGQLNSSEPADTMLPSQRLESGTAKVTLVPKDSRGPRLISQEPLEYMWFQKGLGESIVSHLEKVYPTRGQINFTTQSINRYLSLIGSIRGVLNTPLEAGLRRDILSAQKPLPFLRDGDWVTLDLKDASDRVSLHLVERVFSKCPTLLKCLLALRSTATCLPDGRIVSLKKYAPMGSALCFPVEAYIFWILIVAAISRNESRPLLSIMRDVYVYGDDIIVPRKYAHYAIASLEGAGLKVNTSKCCMSGDFRESCGMDAFRGHDVTPVKLRTLWSGKRTDSALVSYVAYANALRKNYSNAFHTIYWYVEDLFGEVPYGLKDCGYIAWEVASYGELLKANDTLRSVHYKWRRRWQSWVIRVRRVSTETFPSTLDSWKRLLRNLTSGPGRDPSVYTLPKRTKIRFGQAILS